MDLYRKLLVLCHKYFVFVSFLENGNTYQAYVKSRKTQRVDSVRCGTYTHNGIKAKETITFKCQQPLVGTYIEIVPSLKKPIKVFEIEHYGMLIYNLSLLLF